MASRSTYDAVVIGSGPNGLAAAITLAQKGRSVLVLEAQETVGGGARSGELTLPGFVHDICSAVHPMAVASPFFRSLPLEKHGLAWIHPEAPLAHPLDDGTAVVVERSVRVTGANMGGDAARYARLMGPLVSNWPKLEPLVMGPLRVPRHPFAAARFGMVALRSAAALARGAFREERARAAFAGLAAHSVLPMEMRPSAAFGLVLGVAAHAAGWPIPRGGAQSISNALVSYLRSLGGDVTAGRAVASLDELPPARAVLCDVTPRQLLRIAGTKLSPAFRSQLQRYRYGPGVCKVDWALGAPIPWKAEACSRAGTVHVGGTLEEIARSERDAWEGRVAERPFVLLAQPTLFDGSRAPAGKHVAWAYCHVPNGSTADVSGAIEQQIERFAPGFRERILARHVVVAAAMEQHNANLIGGDIGGGAETLAQVFLRPTWRLYRTPAKGVYLCSSSTPPGGGVHGMCGYWAARAALRDGF